jgi:hypothetical protein
MLIPTAWIQDLSMNTRQAVGVRTVDTKPKHSDGVRIQSIGKMMLSRDMDCYVVRTGVGYGTEIQMERSISGGLRWKPSYSERPEYLKRTKRSISGIASIPLPAKLGEDLHEDPSTF